jgi:hypothetical protein
VQLLSGCLFVGILLGVFAIVELLVESIFTAVAK